MAAIRRAGRCNISRYHSKRIQSSSAIVWFLKIPRIHPLGTPFKGNSEWGCVILGCLTSVRRKMRVIKRASTAEVCSEDYIICWSLKTNIIVVTSIKMFIYFKWSSFTVTPILTPLFWVCTRHTLASMSLNTLFSLPEYFSSKYLQAGSLKSLSQWGLC